MGLRILSFHLLFEKLAIRTLYKCNQENKNARTFSIVLLTKLEKKLNSNAEVPCVLDVGCKVKNLSLKA